MHSKLVQSSFFKKSFSVHHFEKVACRRLHRCRVLIGFDIQVSKVIISLACFIAYMTSRKLLMIDEVT